MRGVVYRPAVLPRSISLLERRFLALLDCEAGVLVDVVDKWKAVAVFVVRVRGLQRS